MIDLALQHLAGELNQSLAGIQSGSGPMAIVSNLVGPDGQLAPDIDNKILFTLVAVERDTVPVRAPDQAGGTLAGNAPLYLNLFVLVSANFTGPNYPQGLKFISAAIAFFQRHPTFDRRSTPDLHASVNKLALDIENRTPHEMSNLWGLMGGRYLPSVLYRVRMVAMDGGVTDRLPVVTGPAASVRPAAPVERR
jgi:hypothetical protein